MYSRLQSSRPGTPLPITTHLQSSPLASLPKMWWEFRASLFSEAKTLYPQSLLVAFTEPGTGPVRICKGTKSSPRIPYSPQLVVPPLALGGGHCWGRAQAQISLPLMERSLLCHDTSWLKGPLDSDLAVLFLGMYLFETPAQRCKDNAQSCSLQHCL